MTLLATDLHTPVACAVCLSLQPTYALLSHGASCDQLSWLLLPDRPVLLPSAARTVMWRDVSSARSAPASMRDTDLVDYPHKQCTSTYRSVRPIVRLLPRSDIRRWHDVWTVAGGCLLLPQAEGARVGTASKASLFGRAALCLKSTDSLKQRVKEEEVAPGADRRWRCIETPANGHLP